jgi:hypothetical protein
MKTTNYLKTVVVTCAISLTMMPAITQAQRNCANESHENFLKTKDSKREANRMSYNTMINDYIASNASKTSAVSFTLPIVVHVVYNTAGQNISNAQIISQIDVLNKDFGRTNTDAVNTPTAFAAVAANTNIQFCLAQRDPMGNPSTGIERRSTTVTSFSTDDKVKFYAQGGLDAWDPTKYLNLWVCNFGGGLLGYGEFPTGTVSNTFGAVIQYNAFGNTGNVAAPFNLGRTATHEFSHCFNLFHIWGDDGGACTGSDLCADTPNQADATSGCFTFPKTDACSTTAPGIQFMNYMDYSDDNCMNMFTNNQSTRMNAVLNVAPYNSLKTSNGCMSVALATDDAGITSVLAPMNAYCTNTITPSVVIKNWGSNSLTSAVINYHVDMNTVQTYTYSGSLASLATTTVSLPNITATSGSHTFMAYTTFPNGMADGNTMNDTMMSSFVVNSGLGANLPYTEGFENTTFPTNGITINNYDTATTWARTTVAKKTGLASAFMDNFNYNANGQIDEMVLPSLNFSSVASPQLTFQLAYRLYTAPTATLTFSDTLEVLISSDCGLTWSQVYKKFSTPLTTATPAFSTVSFIPTAAQWRMETISLGSYATINSAIVKFKHITGYENQLYIDDINLNSSTALGMKENDISNLITIYPNPANESFTINIGTELSIKDVSAILIDQLGREVKTKNTIFQNTIGIATTNIANGTYFIKINIQNNTIVKKVIINH